MRDPEGRRVMTDGDEGWYLVPVSRALEFEAWLDGQLYDDFEQYRLDRLEQLLVLEWDEE